MPPKKKSKSGKRSSESTAFSLDHYFESRNARYIPSDASSNQTKTNSLVSLSLKMLATHIHDIKKKRHIHLDDLPPSTIDVLFEYTKHNTQLAPIDWIELFFTPSILVSSLVFDDIRSFEHASVWKHLSDSGAQLNHITKLSLNHLQISDRRLIQVIKNMPNLTHFSARANAKLTNLTASALIKYCPHLEYVNLSLTMAKDEALFLSKLPSLHTLKLGSASIGQHAFSGMVTWSESSSIACQLRNLKLRASKFAEATLVPFLRSCGSQIEVLDILGTNVSHPKKLVQYSTRLKKLNVSYTPVTGVEMGQLLEGHALDCLIAGNCAGIYQSHLRSWKPFLSQMTRFSLFNNDKIYDISELISVLPNIQHLDVSYTRIDPSSFEPWVSKSVIPPLESLNVSNTYVDDALGPALEAVGSTLQELFMEGTRVTLVIVEIIALSCPNVNHLNLDRCRGIPILKRRCVLEEMRHDH